MDPADTQAALESLRDLGYVDFSPDAVEAGEASGVTLHDRGRAQPGFNLYTSRVEPEAYLMDMEGREVHVWRHADPSPALWTLARLTPGGGLLVLAKHRYLMQLDVHSKRVWKRAMPTHHDVSPLPDGGWVTLLRETREHRGLTVKLPAVAWLSALGVERARWSASQHLPELRAGMDDRLFLDRLLDQQLARDPGFDAAELLSDERRTYDYFHANTVSVLPENSLGDARLRAGNLLLCFRNLNQVVVLDQDDLRVTWSHGADDFDWPHHPSMLPNGHMLIFDNGKHRGHTRVVEFDPRDGRVHWEYVGDPPESFFSQTKGSAQRLTGGNTLICEGDAGRVLEVAPDGTRVWEWRNPRMEDGRRAVLYRMQRVTPELGAEVLAAAKAR